ncbi:transcription factor grauzone-like [Musca vetustissima]|uniref:transcription factor grauzone-like n=1 Tax=Musca vetustissima TaxID=27455 RepID=UPI002AB72097|nr:transcription factor grauzone-like [Musca vetustissima]
MLCCVCLLENTGTMGIYESEGIKLKIEDIIQQHLWFKPETNNPLKSHICTVCWEALQDFHVFYQQAKRIHEEYNKPEKKEHFHIKLEEAAISPNVGNADNDELYEDILEMNIEIGESLTKMCDDDEEQDAISKADNPLEELQEKTEDGDIKENNENDDDVKTELHSLKINILNDMEDGMPEASDNECSDDFEQETDCSDDDEDEEEEEDDSISSEEESTTKVVKKRGRKKSDGRADKKEAHKKRTPMEQSIYEIRKKRKELYKIDEKHADEMILKYIPMGCNLCVFVGKTFPDIVEHFKEAHPRVRPYVTCCDKQFTKRCHLAQHALMHEDPNCFKCHECNKNFTSKRGLRAHDLNYHATEEERIFACDICPKKFAARNLLELHKPSHIPREQWAFFCPKCPSSRFASSYLLKVHTSMQHKRTKHVCHVCAKEIRDKHSFEKHVRSHFGEATPRVPCPYPGCDSWLKDEDNLRKHLKRHNLEGITYRCEICDKVYKNRVGLTNHKRYSHTMSANFKCEQCDRSFKKAISLREHMTQHTGETLYKCPFCTRTFNSNANMHAHKKRAHPIEWEEWRRNKTGSAQTIIKQPTSNNL